jgi:hypothetical protein
MSESFEPLQIELWKPDSAQLAADLEMLGSVLHACVSAGASVSFIQPFSHADAIAFWREKVLPTVAAGTCDVLVARRAGQIVGTVQLDLATPPNQPHRAEVKKLLVHLNERRSRTVNRTLLTLDTASGQAEQLYLSLGYVSVGIIPGYSRRPDSPELEGTTVMYKELVPHGSASRSG